MIYSQKPHQNNNIFLAGSPEFDTKNPRLRRHDRLSERGILPFEAALFILPYSSNLNIIGNLRKFTEKCGFLNRQSQIL
jgi:hypothetical protein